MSRKLASVMFYNLLAIVAAFAVPGNTRAPQTELLCLNPSKLYPDHDDCRRFIRCVNRKPVSFSCPPKTAFDPETQICIWRLHFGDCSQGHNIPIWNTESTTMSAQKTIAAQLTTPGSPLNDMTGTTPLGSDFKIVNSADVKSQASFNDLEKILLDFQKQDGNSNLLSTMSSSASKSQITNENSNVHNLGQSDVYDATAKLPFTIPVISDTPIVTTGNSNSKYTEDEDTTMGDNSKYTSKEDTAYRNNSKSSLNEMSTKVYSFTQSDDLPGTESPAINLQQAQQQQTTHEQISIGTNQANPGESGENTDETTNQVILDMVPGNSKVTPAWMIRMNDGKSTTTEKVNENAILSRDTATLTSADMEAKEVVQQRETTTAYNLNLPRVTSNMAATSTSADITVDNKITSFSNEEDDQSVHDDKFQNSVSRLNDSISEQHIERDNVNEESHENPHGVQTPQNATEAAGNTEEGLTEDNITAIITPFSAITNIELKKAQEEMDQLLHRAKDASTPLEKDYQYEESFKSRKYTHPEDQDISNNYGILQTQPPTSSDHNDNKDTVTNTDNAKAIEASTNSTGNLSIIDLSAIDNNTEIKPEQYNKQTFEVTHNISSSTNKTEEVTTSPYNLQGITKPSAKFIVLAASPQESKEIFPISKNTTNYTHAAIDKNQSPNSTDLKSIVDFSTLTSRTAWANRTHVTAAAGIAQRDTVGNSRTTLMPVHTERILNASFMSVPYMIRGLVRPFRCPEPNGHFIDPQNCSVFYHCSRGQAYRRDCPAGQVFLVAALSCVSSKLAPPCQKMDKLQGEDDEERHFQCEKDGYFRDAKQCNVYYICAAGTSMRMTCDPGTSFDVTYNLCLWNSEVHDCNKTLAAIEEKVSAENLALKKNQSELSKLQAAKVEPELTVKGYKCPERKGMFPDLDNCSVFHVCNNGVATRMMCPDGTGYDVKLRTCVDSWLVDSCKGNGYDVKSFDTVAELSIAQFDCPEAHGLYPDPDNCSVFIHCFKNIPYRHTCQADTVFSSEIGVCTWRELVPECQAEAGQPWPEETKPNNIASSQSGLPKSDVVLEPYKQLMPSPESPDTDQQEPGSDVPDFTCPDMADGFFRDNLFCDIFHRCVSGTRFTFTCPSGTFFRLRGNLCDFWENVADCTKDGLRIDAVRSLPEIATLPVPQPLPNEIDMETVSIDADPVPCPESSGLFAHPRNCRQFLFCAQHIPLILTCPESLLYNPLTLTCDFSKNVQCLRYDDYKKV